MTHNRKIKMLILFFRDKNKKKWAQIINEFITLYISKKKIPLYYISNLLYRNNVNDYKNYLSLEESKKILMWSYTKGKHHIAIAHNKLLFEDLLVKNKIETPQIFFHNSNNKLTFRDTIFEIYSKKEFLAFLELFFNTVNVDRIFCKPVNGMMGRGIFILNKNTCNNIEDQFVKLVFSQKYIFQEVIQQHEALNKINPYCINSLRVISYQTDEKKVEILTGVLRVGANKAIVDNTHAGGILTSFNMKNGKLNNEGSQLIDYGGGIFYKHPETGIVFEGFQIPYFDDVKDIVVKASALLDLPLLGWDIAITPNGPVIIEVNHNFHLLSSDRMAKGLRNNPVFNKLFNKVITGN